MNIEIHGYTDSFGSNTKNKLLSEKMAYGVMSYLIEKGINTERLTAKGFGEENPIASNLTVEGREKNRRIEVLRKE